MRIIAGSYSGIRLVAPKGRKTRPTLERVRKSLFQILEPHLPGARVLDLYAGAGTLGLEALSRGAEHVTFVEKAPPAIAALKANIEKLGAESRVKVVRADALAFLARCDHVEGRSGGQSEAQRDGHWEGPWDVILLDPPYGRGLAVETLAEIEKRAASCLAAGGLAIIQMGSKEEVPEVGDSLGPIREKRYGETTVRIYEFLAN